jgi:fructan beta-fructosidase
MKRLLLACCAVVWVGCLAAQTGAPVGTPPPGTPMPVGVPTPQWRPVYHFTPATNWTNDPNGPIFFNGEYHLYNQQNPFENKWGHMSWGHATSTDLVHWKHLAVAIPEKISGSDTTWIFSGSAVWDRNNTSGFGGGLVAIYTADQPHVKKESQYIAYSNDGGMSYTNYAGNPVIDLKKRDFRDPNVFWHEPSKQWVMAVALPSEHKVRFYGSANLKEWGLLSEFGPQGYIGANWECPSLIELPVVGASGGAAVAGRTKWCLMNSAAGGKRGVYMQYFIGNFDGKTFTNDNPAAEELTVDYGDCLYAAIPWNNLPDNGKVLIGWMIPGGQETFPWKGQMSIPRDLSLKKTAAGLRLVQQPTDIIKKELPGDRMSEQMNVVVDGEVAIGKEHGLEGNAYWIDAELELGAGAAAGASAAAGAMTAGFKIAQAKDASGATTAETVIGYDLAKHQLYVDRSRSGQGKMKPGKVRQVIELPNAGDKIRLQVLFDKSSLEIFVNEGEKVLTTYIYPDENATGCSAFATGGSAVIKTLRMWDLSKW